MVVQPAHRDRADLCPGLLRPYLAGDGAIIRLRLPGGELPLRLLAELLTVAEAGAGFVQLTSRGNLQIRGLADPLPDAVVEAVLATGLVPSPAHDRVRNIVASPLSGWWPQNGPGAPRAAADIRRIVAELDTQIRADPALAELPGRFLFAIDDGRGDVLGEPFDVAYRALSPAHGEVRLSGAGGFGVSAPEAAAALADVARAFCEFRRTADPAPWHIRELDRGLPGVLLEDLPACPSAPAPLPGPLGPHLIAALPLGRLTRGTLAAVEPLTDRVILTGWRMIVVPHAAEHRDELAAAGLAVHPDSGWGRVSACTGAPGCTRAPVATEPLAYALVEAVEAGTVRLETPLHLVACDRHCGATAGQRHVLVTTEATTPAELVR